MTTLFTDWIRRLLQRHDTDLSELDDRALADIGVSRSEIDSIESESSGESALTRLRIVARRQFA